jgi:hypothetical protein
MTATTRQLGHDSWGRKIAFGQPGHDSGVGHLGPDSQDRSGVEQVSLDRKERSRWPDHDSKDRTAGTRQLGQKDYGRTARTGQRRRTSRTGQSGLEREDRMART